MCDDEMGEPAVLNIPTVLGCIFLFLPVDSLGFVPTVIMDAAVPGMVILPW